MLHLCSVKEEYIHVEAASLFRPLVADRAGGIHPISDVLPSGDRFEERAQTRDSRIHSNRRRALIEGVGGGVQGAAGYFQYVDDITSSGVLPSVHPCVLTSQKNISKCTGDSKQIWHDDS